MTKILSHITFFSFITECLFFQQKIFIMDQSENESFQIEHDNMTSNLLSYIPTSEELVRLYRMIGMTVFIFFEHPS